MRDNEKDRHEKKGNLAGWIGLLTAIAAILSAIGFNQFFPDIVKRIVPSTPQSNPSTTPTVSVPTQTQLPDPSPTPTTSSSPTPTPTPPNPGSQESTPTISAPLSLLPAQTVPVGDVSFDLQSCQRSGQTVRCNFLVKTQGEDVVLTIDSTWTDRTRLVDSIGTVYTAARAEI
jgi:hypothetical protein